MEVHLLQGEHGEAKISELYGDFTAKVLGLCTLHTVYRSLSSEAWL